MSFHDEREQRFAQAETALTEYFARVEAGEGIEFDAWSAQHAEIAGELEELHELCQPLRRSGARGREDPGASAAHAAAARLALESLRRRPNRYADYEIDARPLASGGMATIFSARDRALGRDLALKMLRDGGEPAARARRVVRFYEEARITSQLDHPGIVPVYEMGLDAAERPYFAMKRVRGATLADVLERRVSGDAAWPRERVLAVLGRVCEAVAFAHRNGVIHRDLKPENVMVGDFGEVYVMDWGLARKLATHDGGVAARSDGPLADAEMLDALRTQDGEVIGTPAYMAPEQALGQRGDVGRHSDVYSLGAMLYQVLAGRPPYAGGRAPVSSRAVLERVAQGPPEPLSRLAADAPAELIAICDKAMERDWRKRYADVAQLSDDLTAFLQGRVVRAHEVGAWAEARKWIQRNRALALAVGVALVFLIGGGVTSLIYAREAREQSRISSEHAATENVAREEAERAAEASRRNEEAAKHSEAEARASGRRAKRVTEFVERALVDSDPNQGGAQNYLVADAMQRALDELERGVLADDPETEASLQSTIARILQGNARAEQALELARQALATRRRLFPGDHQDVHASLNDVACALQRLGRNAEALVEFEAGLEMCRRLNPGDHRDVATELNNVAFCLDNLGRSAQALPLHDEALEMRRRRFEADHADVAQSHNNLALCLGSLGRLPDALPHFQAALEMRRRLHGRDHPDLAASQFNLATCLDHLGRSAEALALYEDALAMGQRLYTGDHPSVAGFSSGLASCLSRLGRREEALALHEEALAMRRRVYAGNHPEIAVGLHNLAACLDDLGRPEEALAHYEAALRMNEELSGGDHPNVVICLHAVGGCLESLRRFDEALELHEAALAMRLRLFGDDHPSLASSHVWVARSLEALGLTDEALASYEAALEGYVRVGPSEEPQIAVCARHIARCLAALDRLEQAVEYAERADALVSRLFPEGHAIRVSTASDLRRLRDALAERERAEAASSTDG
jgi:tetratricopeptide (TPR) repeat protein